MTAALIAVSVALAVAAVVGIAAALIEAYLWRRR